MALVLAASPATALGLGQIEVKSRPGQPLLAEIPIISSDPAELQGLQVQLASPETFRRVGLDPPQGLVSSLHFEPALDGAGHPVIRVTSPTPVQQPLLTFLLEVDWGQGRLVREYSALLDAPRTVSAPIQTPIQAPTVAPPNTIVRPPAAVVVAPAPTSLPTPVVPIARPAPAEAAPPTPAFATRPAVAAEPVAAMASSPANELSPVLAGQTLGQIAAGLEGAKSFSAAQTMLALLRANPDAFIGGNINRVKRGAILRVPTSDEFARLSQRQAAVLVHEQIAQWRDARRPPPQPPAMAAMTAPSPLQGAVATATPARSTDARLEIMPTSNARDLRAASRQAQQSGIQTGGEGEMLRQQLQETKETLAARDAEVDELKTRVAELEKLQQQQQQLITLKDSALATAQQNLESSNRKQATPVAAATTTAQAQPTLATAPPAQDRNSMPWVWGGLALLLAGLMGWRLTRRRRAAVVVTKRTFDTAALAASIPVASHGRQAKDGASAEKMSSMPDDKAEPMLAVSPEQPVSAGPVIPTWHGAMTSADVIPDAPAASDGQQLELAQAYLDIGDDDAARALLRDLLDGRDPAAREAAARLLRDL